MRGHERHQVVEAFAHLGIAVHAVDAGDLFLSRLAGVTDPEEKRKIIGRTFIDVFEKEAKSIPDARYLAQGTLYPDVIESVSIKGPSAVIKTHHNVGGLPERLGFELIEPVRELFKDEVRLLGAELGLPREFLARHPFPGPGLAVRIPGEVTREKVAILQKADEIVLEEIRRAGLYDAISQAFAVLLPVKSVGVMGDGRTHEFVLAVRAVQTTRLHDRRLVPDAPRGARRDREPRRVERARHQPRRLRHHVEAAGDDRVGVGKRGLNVISGTPSGRLRSPEMQV